MRIKGIRYPGLNRSFVRTQFLRDLFHGSMWSNMVEIKLHVFVMVPPMNLGELFHRNSKLIIGVASGTIIRWFTALRYIHRLKRNRRHRSKNKAPRMLTLHQSLRQFSLYNAALYCPISRPSTIHCSVSRLAGQSTRVPKLTHCQ